MKGGSRKPKVVMLKGLPGSALMRWKYLKKKNINIFELIKTILD